MAKALIGTGCNHKILFPTSIPSKRKYHKPPIPRELPIHMSEFQGKQRRCYYCKNISSEHKNFVSCQIYDLYLCLSKERTRFSSITSSFLSQLHCFSYVFLKTDVNLGRTDLRKRLILCRLFGFFLP